MRPFSFQVSDSFLRFWVLFYFGFKVKRRLSALPAEVGGRQGVRGRAVNCSLSKDFTWRVRRDIFAERLWQPPPPLTSRSPSWAMALKLRITPMMVMRFSTLSAPKEKEEHERRECGKMAMVLLLQTQPRPHISNNPLWSTVLFPQFLLPLGDVLTCQLGHQRSHQDGKTGHHRMRHQTSMCLQREKLLYRTDKYVLAPYKGHFIIKLA